MFVTLSYWVTLKLLFEQLSNYIDFTSIQSCDAIYLFINSILNFLTEHLKDTWAGNNCTALKIYHSANTQSYCYPEGYRAVLGAGSRDILNSEWHKRIGHMHSICHVLQQEHTIVRVSV